MTSNSDAINHEQELLRIYRRNIEHYMRQAAAYGGEIAAPLPVANGLREARENVAKIKLTLRSMGVSIEDLRSDFAPDEVPAAPQPAASGPQAAKPASDDFSYDLEAQPWYVESMPDVRRIPNAEIAPLVGQIQVLLLTVNDRELFAVANLLRPLQGYDQILQVSIDKGTYFLGLYGHYPAVLTKSRMGSVGLGAAQLVTSQAQDFWKPRVSIAIGVAFGMDAEKQRIGDVLVASEIIPYNPIRAGTTTIERGQHLASDPTLFNRFDNSYDWKFLRPDGKRCRIHRGAVLSGEELIDNAARKAELRQRFPEAIGGEMEGAGLSSASFYGNRQWILVKAICDWADGTKHSLYQPFAAAAAAALVHHVLSDPDALDG